MATTYVPGTQSFCLVILSLHQMTPLHMAAERGGRLNIVEYLVGKKADINIKDNNGVKICDLTTLVPSQAVERGHCIHIYSSR